MTELSAIEMLRKAARRAGVPLTVGFAAYVLEQRVEETLAKLPRWVQRAIRATAWLRCKLRLRP